MRSLQSCFCFCCSALDEKEESTKRTAEPPPRVLINSGRVEPTSSTYTSAAVTAVYANAAARSPFPSPCLRGRCRVGSLARAITSRPAHAQNVRADVIDGVWSSCGQPQAAAVYCVAGKRPMVYWQEKNEQASSVSRRGCLLKLDMSLGGVRAEKTSIHDLPKTVICRLQCESPSCRESRLAAFAVAPRCLTV